MYRSILDRLDRYAAELLAIGAMIYIDRSIAKGRDRAAAPRSGDESK
jgi:hypothetical protein